jgi:hypothetical protein
VAAHTRARDADHPPCHLLAHSQKSEVLLQVTLSRPTQEEGTFPHPPLLSYQWCPPLGGWHHTATMTTKDTG